jgi:hypothetical protein
MAVLDSTRRREILAYLCRRFGYGGGLTKANVQAAIDATDDWIDANAAAFNAALPEPAKSTLTPVQKTIIFCFTALKRAGIEV